MWLISTYLTGRQTTTVLYIKIIKSNYVTLVQTNTNPNSEKALDTPVLPCGIRIKKKNVKLANTAVRIAQ